MPWPRGSACRAAGSPRPRRLSAPSLGCRADRRQYNARGPCSLRRCCADGLPRRYSQFHRDRLILAKEVVGNQKREIVISWLRHRDIAGFRELICPLWKHHFIGTFQLRLWNAVRSEVVGNQKREIVISWLRHRDIAGFRELICPLWKHHFIGTFQLRLWNAVINYLDSDRYANVARRLMA